MLAPKFIEESEFTSLITDCDVILDVRAESEFLDGALPGAVNCCLLNDTERAQVGTTYKFEGQESAVELGHRLVSGETKSKRVAEWVKILEPAKNPAIYCARGGLRSKISQEWLTDSGISIPRIRGGYKSLRQYLIKLNESLPSSFSFHVISGRTGVGKTTFLNKLKQHRAVIDLEDLAKHRGSTFGNVYGGQPSQANFENQLATSLLKLSKTSSDHALFLEAESRRIGRCFIPLAFWNPMTTSEIYVLEESLETRVDNILNDYVSFVTDRFNALYQDEALSKLGDYLLGSIANISKHLGSERAKNISSLMKIALKHQEDSGEISYHRFWIEPLLVQYYDPHYEKHLEGYKSRVKLRGNSLELESKLSATVCSSLSS